MTTTETRFLQRLIIFLVIAALCPLCAFGYRFLLNVAPETVPGPAPIFTLVPSTGDLGLATPAPTSVVVVVPNGWREYALPESGFALSVPTTWQRLPLRAQELDAALQTIRQSNPELADALGENAPLLMQNGVRFWAFDLTLETQAEFATNVTVTRQTLPAPVPFESYVVVNLNQLNTLAARNSAIVHERTLLAGQPTERVRYSLTLNREDGAPVTVAITQFLLVNGRDAYVLTYTTRTDQIAKYQAIIEQSARSLRLLGQ